MKRAFPVVVVATALTAGLSLLAGGLWWWFGGEEVGIVRVHDPSSEPVRTAPEGAPNVVLIFGCTLRRDQLTVYDPSLATTPWLAALGARGVVFDDMITAAPWTRPASTALITGRHAIGVGMVEPQPGMNRRSLSRDVTTMAEHFRANGYRTLGGTANPNLSSVWTMHQGFDTYVEPNATWSEGVRGKIGAVQLAHEVFAALDETDPSKPAYIQMMFIEAHAPWPELAEVPDDGLPEDVHRYRGAVNQLDHRIEIAHSALEKRGFTDENTLWVVANDHGEGLSFPEHHGPGHGRFLMPSTVGGVWVMAGKGLEPTRVAGVASQVDLFPTVAELAGIPLDDPGDGVSQVSAIRSGQSNRQAAYSDTWFQHISRAAVYTEDVACQQDWSPFAATSMGNFKRGCFDRETDPTHLLAHPDPVLQADLEAWRARKLEEMAAFTGASDADPTQATLNQLEALGYVEEGDADGRPQE